jgi:translation initiation factor 3 subunit B
MAPSFENLPEDDGQNSEEEIDFSDLRAQHEVRLEQGLDAFVVVDGLPIVTDEQKPKLVKFLVKKLNAAGRTREDAVFMPLGDSGKSEG